MGAPYIRMKLQEQQKAMELLGTSPHLRDLQQIKGRYVDLEVAGIPALQYFATRLWPGLPLPAAGAGEGLLSTGARIRTCGDARRLHRFSSVNAACQRWAALVLMCTPLHTIRC